MTTLLVVDDDAAQLRSLSRALASRLRDLTILTATSAPNAIRILEASPVDVVLTDLQMPGMNGFELIAWLIAHAPRVPVLTMTAYWNPQAGERLRELGPTASFTKPLDLAAVAERLSAVAARDIRGHVHNISLAAFLQLVAMEQKSCTLTVEQSGHTGYLHLRDGDLVDASAGELRGEDAALNIACWSAPSIAIGPPADGVARTIHQPLGFILMEAVRRRDEQTHSAEDRPPDEDPLPDALDGASDREPPREVLELPEQTLALAIVDAAGGVLWNQETRASGLAGWASVASVAFGARGLEELIVSGSELGYIARPLSHDPPAFALLLFEPTQTSVGRRRLDLDRLTPELRRIARARAETEP